MKILSKSSSFLYFSIIAILIFCQNSYSQKVTYDDLKKLLNKPLDQVEDILLAKGFKYSGTSNTSGIDIYNFKQTADKNYGKSSESNTVFVNSINSIFYEVTYSTLSYRDYLAFKSSVKSIGYALINTRKLEDNLLYKYRKGRLQIEFMMGNARSTANTDRTMIYNITMSDVDIQEEAFKQ